MLGNDLLEGEKVRLTAITREDLPHFVEWFASMELRRFLGGIAAPFTMEDEEEWWDMQRKAKDQYNFAIRTRDGNRLIGSCGVMDIRWQARNCMAGIVVGDKTYWGQGYGTDALRVLLKFAFMELNLHRVGLEVWSYNVRARKSYEKIGFKTESVSREAVYLDGQYHDAVYMSILWPEWKALYLAGES